MYENTQQLHDSVNVFRDIALQKNRFNYASPTFGDIKINGPLPAPFLRYPATARLADCPLQELDWRDRSC